MNDFRVVISHRHLSFKVTRSRISQMIKIVETLPTDFIDRMRQCQD